nr:MAG TPA: hypothetical protein [Caudoviricetes sp.]
MNYLTEIKLFYDWLETYPLSPASITLWHALMFVANRSGWKPEFCVSIGLLVLRTNLSRSAIYRERICLRTAGRISFRSQGGAADSIYEIHSLECAFASQRGTPSVSESDLASRIASHIGTRLNKLHSFIQEKEKTSKKEKGAAEGKERKSCAKKRESTRLNQAQFLSTLDDRWRELMATWLEYKRTRRESYRSELGARKCLTLLRSLSGDDPSVAAAIIDRSIANNWAGLFPLRTGQTPVSAHGQHPGQIIQPADDERTRSLLKKFNRK